MHACINSSFVFIMSSSPTLAHTRTAFVKGLFEGLCEFAKSMPVDAKEAGSVVMHARVSI
jgi:hypothetical protein